MVVNVTTLTAYEVNLLGPAPTSGANEDAQTQPSGGPTVN